MTVAPTLNWPVSSAERNGDGVRRHAGTGIGNGAHLRHEPVDAVVLGGQLRLGCCGGLPRVSAGIAAACGGHRRAGEAGGCTTGKASGGNPPPKSKVDDDPVERDTDAT